MASQSPPIVSVWEPIDKHCIVVKIQEAAQATLQGQHALKNYEQPQLKALSKQTLETVYNVAFYTYTHTHLPQKFPSINETDIFPTGALKEHATWFNPRKPQTTRANKIIVL
eukprot:1151951-Amphidinium_carterae.1